MVEQYKHYLFAVTSNSESTQDKDGNWSESGVMNVFLSKCREETNGRGSEIQIAGGTFRRFNSLVQLPKGSLKIEDGTSVFVADNADGSGVRIKGTSLRFDNGQLHSRLWV